MLSRSISAGDDDRHERALEVQRARRARRRRIDFYADPLTDRVVDALRTRSAGGDASSILNRIVGDWLTGARDGLRCSPSCASSLAVA